MSGSNNFTIHNPSNANQEPDSTFASDSLTTGGIGTDAILPSPWLNARWYENSVGFYALAQMMANKGYTISKDNAATLATVLANILTNADIKNPLASITFSGTPVFPASTSNGFDMVLSANVTSSSFDVVPTIGQILTFVITQDGTGGRSFVPPASVNGWKQIGLNPNEVTVQQFIVRQDGTIQPYGPLPITGQLVVESAATPIASNTGFTYTVTMSDIVPISAVVVASVAQGSTLQSTLGGITVQVGTISGNQVTLIFSNDWNAPLGWGPCTINLRAI